MSLRDEFASCGLEEGLKRKRPDRKGATASDPANPLQAKEYHAIGARQSKVERATLKFFSRGASQRR